MLSSRIYYVYVLIDPRTDQPFYVGLGKNNRAESHLYNWSSCKDGNPAKYYKIRNIRKAGLEPFVQYYQQDLTRDQAADVEQCLIERWGRLHLGGILTNITEGGDGYAHGHRSVKQHNLFGEYIQTFTSCIEAAKSVGQERSTAIIDCCKQKPNSRSAYGFLWCYEEDQLNLEWCFRNIKPVYQWTLDGELVARYHNISNAVAHTGFDRNGSEISRCCRETHRKCKGFLWTYGEQPKPWKSRKTKRVICTNNHKKFANVREAALWLNAPHGHSTVRAVCDGRQGSYKGYNFDWIA